jgi:predicted extracellular nuclease
MDPNDLPASGTSSSGRGQVAAIHAYEQQMTLRSLLLDDASSAQWPEPTPYLNAQGTRRCGDAVTGLTGILTFSNGAYRVQPTEAVVFTDANPRPLTPPVTAGRLKVAAMNVLNYFITFGGSNDRGASNADEFARQKAKVITALAALDADVLGLIEIQNSSAAMTDLLTALNSAVAVPYSFVPDPVGGYPVAGVVGDYIRCVLLYRPSRVTLFGPCHMDANAVWATPNPLRFPLAQVFEEISSGERFLLCLNHWKSKSSSGATGLIVVVMKHSVH